MPDREFIHCAADVTSTLLYALDHGFQVRHDQPQTEPEPRMIERADIADLRRGVFFLFRPEWVYGPWQIGQITGGYNAGKYSISPHVNYASLEVYFHGERMEGERRKLGGAAVSFNRDWLEKPAKIIRWSPPEVEQWYKKFVKLLASGVVIQAGVHKYRVTKGVLADPDYRECIPPFDYIPWDFWKEPAE
jgi:hypothetical protein